MGLPEQFVIPAASNAYNFPSPAATYTAPLATAGDEKICPLIVAALHSGAQTFGLSQINEALERAGL